MLTEFDKRHIEDIIGGYGDWFSAELLRLIAKADMQNRLRLAQAYPDHVQAFLEWRDGCN